MVEANNPLVREVEQSLAALNRWEAYTRTAEACYTQLAA
jgi:hypothetical protein